MVNLPSLESTNPSFWFGRENRTGVSGSGLPAIVCPVDSNHFNILFDYWRKPSSSEATYFVYANYFLDGNGHFSYVSHEILPLTLFVNQPNNYNAFESCYRNFDDNGKTLYPSDGFSIRPVGSSLSSKFPLANQSDLTRYLPNTMDDYNFYNNYDLSFQLVSIVGFLLILFACFKIFIHPFWRKIGK